MKALEILKMDANNRYALIASHTQEELKEVILEIEQLQNRSCRNCNHYQNEISPEEIACNFISGFFNMETFKYCGNWEARL